MKFIATIVLGTDFNMSFVVVPIAAIVHPLCVIPDDDDDNMERYFVILPKHNWSFFSEIILSRKMIIN